jgi:HEAT repeat protein
MGIVYLFKQDVGNVEKLRGRKDVLGLIKVLQSKSDSEVRIKAEKALGDLGAEIAVEPLILALKDDNWRVRYEAARALGKIKGAMAVEPLIQILKDEDGDFRMRAAAALDELDWKPGDDTERSHYSIAKKEWDELARLGEQAVEPIILALKDESWEVRRGAAAALGEIGDVRAVEPLILALNDEYRNVNIKAEKALVKIGEPAVEPLILALKDESGGVHGGAVRVLGEIGDARAVEPLTQALHSQVTTQQEVKDALEKIEKRR